MSRVSSNNGINEGSGKVCASAILYEPGNTVVEKDISVKALKNDSGLTQHTKKQ